MMAAARILIWLPVSLVRRSSISNMAFPPNGASSFFGRASRLRTASAEMLRCRCGERQAQGDAGQVRTMRCSERGRLVPDRTTADCGSRIVRPPLARLYRNLLLAPYIEFVDAVWIPEHSEHYFRSRDPLALPPSRRALYCLTSCLICPAPDRHLRAEIV